MQPLVSDVVQEDPEKCLTIDEVVACFQVIRKKLRVMKLHSHAGDRNETFGPFCNFTHFFGSAKYTLQGIPVVPNKYY
jgi:hypothetical protein